jgi:hypothetical protein
LAVTEGVVPAFCGSILAECPAAIRPKSMLPYIPGYADGKMVQLGLPGRAYAFLEKPFSRDVLIWKVCELLN